MWWRVTENSHFQSRLEVRCVVANLLGAVAEALVPTNGPDVLLSFLRRRGVCGGHGGASLRPATAADWKTRVLLGGDSLLANWICQLNKIHKSAG